MYTFAQTNYLHNAARIHLVIELHVKRVISSKGCKNVGSERKSLVGKNSKFSKSGSNLVRQPNFVCDTTVMSASYFWPPAE